MLIGKCFAWVIQWCLLVSIGNVAFFCCIIKLNTTKTAWLCGGALLQKISDPSPSSSYASTLYPARMEVYEFIVTVHLRPKRQSIHSGYVQSGPYFLHYCHKSDWFYSLLPHALDKVINTNISTLTTGTHGMLILVSLVRHICSLLKILLKPLSWPLFTGFWWLNHFTEHLIVCFYGT